MGKCYMRRTNSNPTMSLSVRRLSSVLSIGLLLSLPMISEKVIPCATRYVFGIHPRLHVSAWRSFLAWSSRDQKTYVPMVVINQSRWAQYDERPRNAIMIDEYTFTITFIFEAGGAVSRVEACNFPASLTRITGSDKCIQGHSFTRK